MVGISLQLRSPKRSLQAADTVFVRVDQNKLWWVKDDETGSVDIW